MAAVTALAIGSAVASVADGIMQFQQGRAQQDIAKQQARISIAKGNIAKFQQQQEAERIRRQATAEAGRGGGTLTGSYLENLNRSMTNAELDREMIGFNAKVQAENFISQGRAARAAGTASLLGSVASAGTGLSKAGIFSRTATTPNVTQLQSVMKGIA